ncbi:MAG: MATE family efflux transporter [Bifidobacteriaceae bacterium]|nr:MATE family efflux transporter [Bifidobacteriaceae bacterium]
MVHASNTRHHTAEVIEPVRTSHTTEPVDTKSVDTKPTNAQPTNASANTKPTHTTNQANRQNPRQPAPSRTHSSTGNLTHGPLIPAMLRFSIPYLITCFLQSCYELADLLIVGRFNGADSVSAVSTGSQMTHLVTVTIVGLTTGVTVTISHAIGARRMDKVQRQIGQSIRLFALVAIIATVILIACADPLLRLLSTPPEALSQAHDYVTICFLGIPFIVAYNVISAIFRGFGDSRHPMYFVALAGLLNVGLDLAFIGGAHMQAAGAALATVISQAFSVAAALAYLKIASTGIRLRTTDLAYDWAGTRQILTIGTPIAIQELCIQVSFIVITAIANGRGLEISASVGIVEKVISFLFLVPSAMLSTVSVVAGQNAGARHHSRSKTALRYGITMCVIYGAVICIACQMWGADIVQIFSPDDETVVRYGAQYLSSYSFDCILAGVHFCFSGFFSAYGKSMYTFAHNIISVLAVRIPGAYFASLLWPDNLFPMGCAAPLGSLLSIMICAGLYYSRFSRRHPVALSA